MLLPTSSALQKKNQKKQKTVQQKVSSILEGPLGLVEMLWKAPRLCSPAQRGSEGPWVLSWERAGPDKWTQKGTADNGHASPPPLTAAPSLARGNHKVSQPPLPGVQIAG